MVVAGYGSWAKTAVNPAAEVVASLQTLEPENYHLHSLEIPVDSEKLYGRLQAALLKYKPDLWIGVGVAVESPAIRLESVGINVRYFDVPDNAGARLAATPVVPGGPVAYESALPNDAIVECLRDAQIPALVSYHAGTHLCNQMLYSVLDLTVKEKLDLVSGFIHVPQSTANVALLDGREGLCSSMSISLMTQAVQLAIDCAVRKLPAAI